MQQELNPIFPKKRPSARQKKARVSGGARQAEKSRTSAKGGRKRRRGRFSFLKLPRWALWLGGVLLAALYVFLFYYFFVDPFSFRWQALYGDSDIPSGYSVHGIDISRYQGDIDWEVLRNARIKYAPVRFVFIKGTEGVSIVDEKFSHNIQEARKNDFLCGVYHFYTPDVDARSQAAFFMKQVHLEPGDLPPVLDVEKAGDLTVPQLQREVKLWLDMVEQRYHVKPIIYSGFKFKLKYLNDSIFNAYPFWIAHYYVDKLAYKGPWRFWQHTDCGKVKGIKGFVDCNVFNGTVADLQQMTIPEEKTE